MKTITNSYYSLSLFLLFTMLFSVELDRFEQPESINSKSIAEKIEANLILIKGGKYNFPDQETYRGIEYFEGKLNDFYLSKFELTQKEWKTIMGTLPPKLNNGKSGDHPIEMVTWDEVNQFIKKLNEISGLKYRLPTNTEWEYAARGGQKSKNYLYSGSNNPAHDAVWHGGNVPLANQEKQKYTMPVGKKKPNELGLYDMSGNVEEWVGDCIGKHHMGSTFFVDGDQFKVTNICDVRMARGGGASNWIYKCTITSSNHYPRIQRMSTLGFRLARDVH